MKKTIEILIDFSVALILFYSAISKSIPLYANCLIIILFLAHLLYNYGLKKTGVKRGKKSIILQTIMSLILISFYFLLGSKMGYSINYSFIFGGYTTIPVWLSTIIIVICIEFIRYIKINKTIKNKKVLIIDNILTMIIYMLVDLLISTKGYSVGSLKHLYVLIVLILGESFTKNLYLNYLTEKFGYIPCLIYRFIIELYVLFIPIAPDINLMIEAVLFTIYPYICYIIFESIENKKKISDIKKEQKISYKATTLILLVLTIFFITIVSGEFKYTIMSIGSESMTGAIDKGDAIIYEKYSPEMNSGIKKGDILVYNKNGMTIIHRIEKVYSLDNEITLITKGDANTEEDTWRVTQDDIIGVVRLRLKFVGYPSILLNELF